MERRHVPLLPDAVDDGVAAVRLLAVDEDAGGRIDEPVSNTELRPFSYVVLVLVGRGAQAPTTSSG
jgi:hypothetical protein